MHRGLPIDFLTKKHLCASSHYIAYPFPDTAITPTDNHLTISGMLHFTACHTVHGMCDQYNLSIKLATFVQNNLSLCVLQKCHFITIKNVNQINDMHAFSYLTALYFLR